MTLPRRLVAECLGKALLVYTVVDSEIMADRLTSDTALAHLGNTLPMGAMLVVLITILGPVSGAQFNPAVTVVFALRRDMAARQALAYAVAQLAGGVAGCWLAHGMFDLPICRSGRWPGRCAPARRNGSRKVSRPLGWC